MSLTKTSSKTSSSSHQTFHRVASKCKPRIVEESTTLTALAPIWPRPLAQCNQFLIKFRCEILKFTIWTYPFTTMPTTARRSQSSIRCLTRPSHPAQAIQHTVKRHLILGLRQTAAIILHSSTKTIIRFTLNRTISSSTGPWRSLLKQMLKAQRQQQPTQHSHSRPQQDTLTGVARWKTCSSQTLTKIAERKCP